MKEFILQLPWPAAELSPNARVHWGKKAKAVEAAKNAAYYTARERIPQAFPMSENAAFYLTVIAFPPDSTRRDEDNIKASLKPAIDGMCLALGIDDARITQSRTIKAGIEKDGKIKMILAELEDGKPWRCLKCNTALGTVVRKPSGTTVLRIQGAGAPIDLDSGSVTCPVCRSSRKWVVSENRLAELLDHLRHFHENVV